MTEKNNVIVGKFRLYIKVLIRLLYPYNNARTTLINSNFNYNAYFGLKQVMKFVFYSIFFWIGWYSFKNTNLVNKIASFKSLSLLFHNTENIIFYMEYSFLQFSRVHLGLMFGTNPTRLSPESTLPHAFPPPVLPSSALLPTLLPDARDYSQLVETCWYSWQHQHSPGILPPPTPPTPTVDQHVLFISSKSELCNSTNSSVSL